MKSYLLLVIVGALLVVAAIYAYAPVSHDWQEISYTVQDGDTLWSICENYCPNSMDLREYIHLVQEANGKNSATIYIGEVITLLQAK